MVDFTPQPGPMVTSQAPRPGVSPGQIAQPYSEFADALDKSGEALGAAAETAATQAGYKAVTRDDQGNIQIEKAPILGPASIAYSRAVKFAALAEGEAALKQKDIALRTQYRDDPQGYLAAADAFKKDTVDAYSKAGGADLGITLGKTIDATTTQTFRGLLNESERLALLRADKSISAQVDSTKDDLLALARGGDTSSPAFMAGMDKINTLTQERVNNPRLAYPPEAAQYDRDQFDGQLKGNLFLNHVDQTYKDKGVNDDGSAKGGAQPALEAAKSILTDASLKLTQQQRNQFYSKAVGEIHANEAIRRQDIGEAHAAEQSLRMTSAYGGKVAPEDIEGVAQAYRAAGAPGEVARLYAWASRAPLGDDFVRQPFNDQVEQFNALRGAPRQQAAFQFFVNKGWSPAQAAGIVGGLRGETANLNTAQLHDGGIGIGISGWNGERRAALVDFAKANGLNALDLNTQLEFVNHELHSNEAGAGSKLKAAQTPEDAGNAMLSYLRPANFDVPGAHPERAHYARLAFDAFSGQPSAVPGGVATTPAGALWLQANRGRQIDAEATQAWAGIMKDYTAKGIRPADDIISQVVNAARATNNHALLETISAGVQQMDLAQHQAQQPLAQQQSDITRLEQAGQTGQLTPGQQGVLKDLQGRYAAITKGLEDNPIGTTVANFGDRFNVPPPITAQVLQDPQAFAANLGQRAQIAQFAQQNWGGKMPPALDKADLAQVTASLDTPDPAAKAQIFKAIATLPEQVRNATLAKIGEKRSDFMVAAAAGGLMSQAPDVATSILRGQEALKTDKGYWPSAPGETAAIPAAMDKVLPPTAFSLAGRTDDSGPYAVARGMVRARYADLSAQAGDTSGKLNTDRLKTASDDVTGGILNMNGGSFIAPVRGMPQPIFDRTMYGITDKDMAGVTTLNGAPVTPEYLRQNSQLESVGDGRYLVRLGKDPMRPIYAYTGANSAMPQKFVLDLRGRQLGDLPAGQAGDIGNSP